MMAEIFSGLVSMPRLETIKPSSICNTPGVCHQLSNGFELKHGILSDDEDVKVKPMEMSPNLNLGIMANTMELEVESTLEQEIRKGQLNDERIKDIAERIVIGKALGFHMDDQGTVWFGKRICVLEVKSIRESILREAHDSAYSIHSGSTKMYLDLRERY